MPLDLTERRKISHIRICMEKDVQALKVNAGFDDVLMVHRAVPEINLEDIDLSTEIFGHRLASPMIIASMTGGTVAAVKINRALAEAASELNIGMGVGSQRAAIENREVSESFRVVRDSAPDAFLIANIGAPQLANGWGMDKVQAAIDMIEADALAVHLNPLQEAMQREGETAYGGVLAKIAEICSQLDVPVIAKETGAGISAEDAKRLEAAGVDGFDVGGAGGTSWAAVEYYRSEEAGDELHARLGKTFWDWGIPTAVSVLEAKSSSTLPVIATGGVRSGIDVAKAVALGAEAAGIAWPLLKPAAEGKEEVVKNLGFVIEELRNAMFLTGAKDVSQLRSAPLVVTGRTREWLRSRGFNPSALARR